MIIEFTVNQPEALRRGIDTPGRKVELKIDPAELSEPQRQVLAQALDENSTRGNAIFASKPVSIDNQFCGKQMPLVLVVPTVEGVRMALDEVLAMRVQAGVDRQKLQNEQLDRLRARLSETRHEQLQFGLNNNGELVWNTWNVVSTTVDVVLPVEISTSDTVPEDLAEVIRRHNSERDAKRRGIVEAHLPELRAKLAAIQADAAAQKAASEALYQRLPALLRNKHEAGFAPKSEVEEAIALLMCEDAGYRMPPPWARETKLHHLTDPEYAEWRAADETKPEGATIETLVLRDDIICDEHGDDTPDCEGCQREHARRVAEITWTRGSYKAVVHLALNSKNSGNMQLASEYARARRAATKQ